jgi:predicted helicase
VDSFRLARGYWEAKDEGDNLEKEIKKKFEIGYPKKNIIFQEPEKAILFQGGIRQPLNEDISDSGNLVELLKQFFAYREPQHEEWETAVAEFSEKIPDIAKAVKEIIEKERKRNSKFVASFEGFVALCRRAINPNLSDEAVETMLIQHLLTERIFRKVFNNEQFTKRNIIAVEIEKVIDSLTSKHFSRDSFLQELNRFYHAIEVNAENATDYTEKQAFLNTVYERFFQGFSKKEADTHGIVYTPQPIVDFMVRSVEDILQKEFGKSLSDEGVHILDPFVGTGNFITRVMKEIKSTKLRQQYENELHCNEIMLLPYYIASMNIEHEYLERLGEYRPFPGICMVDTFELAEAQQTSMFTAENTERVERQKRSSITVIIGNPPYNAKQESADDNNRNRKYKHIDVKLAETYVADSSATLRSSLSDPYVKAIRWATDRLGEEGVVAFVCNNSFSDNIAFDGMRSHLRSDFDAIYVLDLGGNVRKNPKLSGTTHNVFGIQVGVSVNFFIRRSIRSSAPANVFVFRTEEFARKEAKFDLLDEKGEISGVQWKDVSKNSDSWLTDGQDSGFERGVALLEDDCGLFALSSNGIKTNRDAWLFSFAADQLQGNVKRLIRKYNEERERWLIARKPKSNVDTFLEYEVKEISWSAGLKNLLLRNVQIQFTKANVRKSVYRPFTASWTYFDRYLTERRLNRKTNASVSRA